MRAEGVTCPGTSQLVAEVLIESVDTHRVEDEAFPYAIETVTTARPLQVFDGSVATDTLTIWQAGGIISPTEWMLARHDRVLVPGAVTTLCLSRDIGTLAAARKMPADAPRLWLVDGADDASPVAEEISPLLPVVDVGAAPADPGYITNGPTFHYQDMPINFYVNANTSQVSGERAAIDAGAASWEAHTTSWVNLNDVGSTSIARVDPSDGKHVAFFSKSPDDPLCRKFSARTWINQTWDIEFNDNCKYSTASPTPDGYADVQAVAVHEFGHTLGLEHTTVTGNVMCVRVRSDNTAYSCASPPLEQRSLGSGDRAGIRSLYPYGDYRATTSKQKSVTFPVIPDVGDPAGVETPGTTVDLSSVATAEFTFRNDGRTPWGPFHTVRLRYIDGGCSRFADMETWIDCNDVVSTGFVDGEIGAKALTVKFRAPYFMKAGVYTEHYRLEAIGARQFGTTVTVTFNKPVGGVTTEVPVVEAPMPVIDPVETGPTPE